jgi:hypothetical protein
MQACAHMVMRIWIKIAGVAVFATLAASVYFAWQGARKDQAKLQSELKTTQEALADATARQTTRDAALKTLLAGLKKQKAEVQQPAQVITALPGVLPLPQAITLESTETVGPTVQRSGTRSGDQHKVPASHPLSGQADGGRSARPAQEKADFPTADLKPLYDFAVDCKACQAQLAASQADLKDEQAKALALGRERDDALKAARGGSVLRQVARAAKWFAIGAAAGAIAAKAAR